jgi:hypothetical protein
MPAGRAGASKQERIFRQYFDNAVQQCRATMSRAGAVIPRGLVVPFKVFNFLFGD